MSEVKVQVPVLRGVLGKKRLPTAGIPQIGILWIPYRQAIVMCLPTWRKGAIQLWLRERHMCIHSSRLMRPSSISLWCLELESAFKEVSALQDHKLHDPAHSEAQTDRPTNSCNKGFACLIKHIRQITILLLRVTNMA